MNDSIGYIFHELASSDVEIKTINKTLKAQMRANRSFIILTIGIMACACVLKKQVKEHNKAIKEIQDKIAALEARKEKPEL